MPETMTPAVARVRAIASAHLREIAALFTPDAKLTLLVRSPSAPDGARDLVLTTDDLRAVITALAIRHMADTERAAPAEEEDLTEVEVAFVNGMLEGFYLARHVEGPLHGLVATVAACSYSRPLAARAALQAGGG